MVCAGSLTTTALGAAATGGSGVGSGTGLGGVGVAPRYVMYFDQYHVTALPNNTMTAGITHVITAFANSSLFTTEPAGTYTPFMDLTEVRGMFDNGTKVCMAIGGWGDTEGFRVGLATEESRALYAKNIATTLDTLGYDCVDIDYEYPGGNGYDYLQVDNADLVSEIETYPLLLSAIKEAIGTKELSIAVPGLERDMIAYTAEKVPAIDAACDFVNIMTYDLINRRDATSKHHTDIAGSLAAVEAYIARGLTPSKINLGFAMYAKWFTLPSNSTCTGPIGCPLLASEDAQGVDLGTSGAQTFEISSFPPAPVDPSTLTPSVDGSCGTGTTFTCLGVADGTCCSQYGFCGASAAHCGTGCQTPFSEGCTAATTKTVAESFEDALANGVEDTEHGGQWWIDTEASLFWTWDTNAIMTRKFSEIVVAKGLGGIMAWSLGEDSYDYSRLATLQEGFAGLRASAAAAKTRKMRRHRQY